MDRWSRRQFVQGAGAAGLGLLAGCGRLPGQAQPPPKVRQIGFLSPSTRESDEPSIEAFLQGLRELGYVDGQNIAIEYRFADGAADRYADLAGELVGLQVDVIVTYASGAIRAANQATSTIPIVFAVTGDPVGTGLVNSLARPGGNVTGLTNMAEQLSAKRVELLKEAFPGVSRLAALWNPAGQGMAQAFGETLVAARVLGLQVISLEVRSPDDFGRAFEVAAREQADSLITFGDPLTNRNRARIVELAAHSRLPATYTSPEFAAAGGLMAYGPSERDLFRRAATYVDKILRGAKPADLPVEQPTTFDFVINLKTAQALGLTIPEHVLLQATEVIQ